MGPVGSKLLLVGEALGDDEVRQGKPFVGKAGGILGRVLTRSGLDREDLRIDNTLRCQPPGNWFEGPWEREAVIHCSQYLDQTLQEAPEVVIALGGAATRRLLGIPKEGFKLQDWHGLAIREPRDRFWVVPTFHPAFVFKRGPGIIGAIQYDFAVAKEVLAKGWQKEDAQLLIDPPIEVFERWVDDYLASPDAWLACDIETLEKIRGKSEEDLEETTGDIIRINFSHNPGEGITVPWSGQYLSGIQRLLRSPGVKAWWNARYDIPILRAHGYAPSGTNLDFMWGWHVLQSDLPRGLGFAAPFYSRFGPWKHLSGPDPARYAAIDAVQTIRCAFGIAGGLQKSGQWDTFWNHVYQLDTRVLHPAEEVGLQVNRQALTEFKEKLLKVEAEKLGSLSGCVPEGALPLHPNGGWTRVPELPLTVRYKRGKKDLEVSYPEAIEVKEPRLVQVCLACSAVQIAKSHRCKDRALTPNIDLQELAVSRWYVREPFNPGSSDHLVLYAESQKITLPKSKSKKRKTEGPGTDKEALKRLAKQTGNPFFQTLLDWRAVSKVRGTYAEGVEQRLGKDDRIHARFMHTPSTGRLSCVEPNLTNVVADRDGAEGIAAGFRACLVASPGHFLVEADFSAIEAVQTGWYSGDPDYIRLARLGVHAYLASHLIGRPADLKWSDADLGKCFKDIKKHFKQDYDRAKRCVHGTNYGLSVYGMVNNYPEIFDKRGAERVQKLYFELCPKLKAWQDSVRERAAKQNYLGGNDHPYRYKHWFWMVKSYDSKTRKWGPGQDSKRVVAFYPQSTAAGKIKEAALGITDTGSPNYLGDAFAGRTSLRALVHDSILVEVPERALEATVYKLQREMTKPILQQPCPESWRMGQHLAIGVAIKWGRDWLDMEEYDLKEVGVASDAKVRDLEEEEEVA